MLAADVGVWAAALVPVLGALTALLTAAWKLSQTFAQFRAEHRALVVDLKARTEQLEAKTPGAHVLPESEAVKAARNGP